MKKIKRLTLLLAAAMLLGILAGCGGSPEASSMDAVSSSETEVPAAPEENVMESGETSAVDSAQEEIAVPVSDKIPENYPMIADGGMTVTAFQSSNPNMVSLITDYNDLVWWQELTQRTGIGFEWTMVAYATATEQFNLLVAASDLPSLVCTAQYYTEGYGISSAVEKEIYTDLADYLPEYAPDYYAMTQKDGARQIAYDENGSIVCFYEIGMEEFIPNNGVFLRGDLLEEQGLEVPITYDQYEDVLLKLKDAYNLPAPIFHYTENDEWLSAGKNVDLGFSLTEDGSLIYGPVEDAYRDYLKTMNKWFKEGLIYKDFYAIPDGQNINYMVQNMSTGDSVVTFGYCEFAGLIQLEDGHFVAGYIPRDNEDQQVHLTEGVDRVFNTGRSFAISTNATTEEVQALCLMMNYLYTEEGALFSNYGVEGETFEYREDGTPWYTDVITNNTDGLTLTQSLLMHIGYMVPSYADFVKYNVSSLTTWADFVDAWSKADNAYALPNLSLTTQESEDYSAVSADVETYLDEALVKFINGDLDINDDGVWADYLAKLDNLGVQTMIDIYAGALERYRSA